MIICGDIIINYLRRWWWWWWWTETKFFNQLHSI